MAEEWDVRGAHEEAVEERAKHREPFGQQVAIFSALLATVGAIVSFLGGHEQNDALYYKNEAVLMKARASDAWAYYQAEDIKRHLAETTAALSPSDQARHAADVARYTRRGHALRATAESYDRRSELADDEARRALRPHTKLAIAMSLLQIGIALASISALTRRPWLLRGAGVFALIGIGLSIGAWF